MLRGHAWVFAKARWDSFLPSVSQYDVRVWVLGHPIIGMIVQDVMCLGSDWVTSEPDHSPIPPRRPGSSPCAKEVWAVPLQSWNSYHVDFSKEMHHIVALYAAGTTKWWMEWLVRKGYAHTHSASPLLPLPSHPQSLHTWSACAHQARTLWRPCGQRNVWAVAFCRATLRGRGHKTKALTTWKNSCNLQEEVEDLRDDVWILLSGVKCQTWGGFCSLCPSIMSISLTPQTVIPDPH